MTDVSTPQVTTTVWNFIKGVFAFWVIVCVFWTIYDVSNSYLEQSSAQKEAFQKDCTDSLGRVRTDSWLFGVDLFCDETDGSVSAYRFQREPHEASFFVLSVTRYLDRVSLNLAGFEQHFFGSSKGA